MKNFETDILATLRDKNKFKKTKNLYFSIFYTPNVLRFFRYWISPHPFVLVTNQNIIHKLRIIQ